MKRWTIPLLVMALAVLTAEGVARLAFDFPLYAADDQLGYWPRPSQQGTFLFTNDLAFNAHGLGVAQPFAPSEKKDVLLIGDSIVYGGNGLRQAEKLGPMIEEQTGWSVWPAAAGSWGLQNELEFLRRHPDLLRGSDAVVFVVNSAT